MMIDHVCLATRNVYVTASRLRERLGLESYDGGWFPHTGVAMRVVPTKTCLNSWRPRAE